MKWQEVTKRCLACEGNWPVGTATRWRSSDLVETCAVCGGTCEEKTWICGEPILGCSVHRVEEGWQGVVVIFNEIYKMQVRPTNEEAMTEVESRFNRLYEQYHEVVN